MKRLILLPAILLLLPLAPLSSKGAESLLVATGFGHFLFETVGEAGGFVDSGGANLTQGQVLDGAQIGVVEIGAFGFSLGEIGPIEFGARQFGIGQVGIIKLCSAEVGFAQVGAHHVGVAQVGAAQVGPGEVGPDQVLPGQIDPVQVFLVQLRQPAF